jgi:DnaJ-class molecular chaperone
METATVRQVRFCKHARLYNEYRGTDKPKKVMRCLVTCMICRGSGKVITCQKCDGAGLLKGDACGACNTTGFVAYSGVQAAK